MILERPFVWRLEITILYYVVGFVGIFEPSMTRTLTFSALSAQALDAKPHQALALGLEAYEL